MNTTFTPPDASDPPDDQPVAKTVPSRVEKLLPELIAAAEQPTAMPREFSPQAAGDLALYLLKTTLYEAAGRTGELKAGARTGATSGGSAKVTSSPGGASAAATGLAAFAQAARGALRGGGLPSQMAVAIMSRYFAAKEPKNFLVQRDFFDKFRDVRLGRLSYAHLPRSACAYVELPSPVHDDYGHSFTGFFFYSGPLAPLLAQVEAEVEFRRYSHTDRCVAMAYLDKNDLSVNYVLRPWPVDETMTVAASIDGTHYHGQAEAEGDGSRGEVGGGHAADSGIVEQAVEGYPEYVRTLFNLLAYIESGDPDLREWKNAPRLRGGPGSRPVNADRDLSALNLTLVNFSYKKSPLYETGEWSVEPHLRAVSGGEHSGGRGARLVWVRSHIRRRQQPLRGEVAAHDFTEAGEDSSAILKKNEPA